MGEVVKGDDPAEARKAAARSMTIAELCDLYLAEGAGHKKPSTIKNDRGRIMHHIKPLIGRLRLDKITRAEIDRMMREIAAGKTANPSPAERRPGSIVRGGSGTAGQALAVLGAMMSFAQARGLRNDNPVRGVKKPPVRKMERFLSEAEIARLGEALHAETAATADPYPAAAIRLLLFTGCRRSEILGLQWKWIDFERAVISCRTARPAAEPVYLNAPALGVLADLPRQQDNPHVVCGHREGGAYVGLDKVWCRVRSAAALPASRLHDLRHSFASIGAASGNSLLIVGKLLGHRNAATTERYPHLSADPMRQAAEAIGQRIAAALRGKAGQPSFSFHRHGAQARIAFGAARFEGRPSG